jgi:multiple sugar transport system permease protein
MQGSLITRILRDVTAVVVVGIFMFPIFWWGLTSIKPISAIFNKDEVVFFDFEPTLVNYQVVLFGAAYALSRINFRGRQAYLNWILSQRFMPPIAIIVPIVFMFHYAGLRDTVIGLIFIHTLINLPVAVLLMKSFFDDVPVDVDEAAMLDGATRFQIFRKVILPLVTGGVAATAVLCFIFSWTEFLLSLFLTNQIRTLPVKISTFVTSTGSEWGFISALGTSAIVPSFIFILLVQKQLVRGLTLGSLKD